MPDRDNTHEISLDYYTLADLKQKKEWATNLGLR